MTSQKSETYLHTRVGAYALNIIYNAMKSAPIICYEAAIKFSLFVNELEERRRPWSLDTYWRKTRSLEGLESSPRYSQVVPVCPWLFKVVSMQW